MARYKAYKHAQMKMVAVGLEHQILPGTFEWSSFRDYYYAYRREQHYPLWQGCEFLSAAGFSQIGVEANAGSFRFFAQESIRFVQTNRTFKLGMPMPMELLWSPLWALLASLLPLPIFLACGYLDRFGREQHFTVGYHVTAIRG